MFAVLALEVVMIAAAFAWVACYSLVLRPGGDPALYEAYAEVACPIVSVVAGVPVFFAAGRWLAHTGLRAVLVTVAAYIAIDLLLIALYPTEHSWYVWLMSAVSHTTKLAASCLGVRRAVATRAA